MDNIKKDLSSYLLDLEKNYNLLSWEINSVFVWEIIRVKLFLLLQEKIAGDSFGSSAALNLSAKLKIQFLRVWKNGIYKNPFLSSFKGQVIIFESGRKYKLEGLYADIYTVFLIEHFNKEKILYEVIETNYKYDSTIKEDEKVQHIDFIKLIAKILGKRIKINFKEFDVVLISKIESEIFDQLSIKINLSNLIDNEYKIFRSEKYIYKKLFKLKNTRQVFIVNYSDYFSLISAAKDLNIETIELQHGLIIKEALIYNFPNSIENKMRYFPSKFYVWEGFNYNSGKLPLTSDNIVPNPFNHLEFMKTQFKDVIRNAKTITVASQPVLSKKIQNYILKNAKQLSDYIFIYKLHPMEFENFFESETAQSLKKLNNIIFVRNEESMYKLLKVSKYIFGIYSTSLFEAEMFGCIPMVLSTESIFAQSLVESKNTILIDANTPLAQYIEIN